MKDNEKKTSEQDVELNLEDVGDKVIGGHISTGGGASLEFLEGEELLGVFANS